MQTVREWYAAQGREIADDAVLGVMSCTNCTGTFVAHAGTQCDADGAVFCDGCCDE